MSSHRSKPFAARLRDPFRFLFRHRTLIRAMAARDLLSPHAGSMLGSVWAVLEPLFFIALITVVFNVLLGARFGGTDGMPLGYPAFILAGLVPWQAMAVVLGRSCYEVIGNTNLVKQVVFPLEVLPIRGVVSSSPALIIGLAFLTIYAWWTTGSVPWTYALIPVLLFFQVLLMFGCALLLAALCVYLRDLIAIVRLLILAGLYLSPVIFIPSMIPPFFVPIIRSNPFSYMAWCYQDICYYGRIEHPIAWPIFIGLSVATFLVGFHVFRKLKHMFGDAL